MRPADDRLGECYPRRLDPAVLQDILLDHAELYESLRERAD